MAYRLPGGRSELTVGDLTIEAQAIVAWPLYLEAVALAAAYFSASKPADEYAALEKVYGFFCLEAQPTWAIVDHRGAIAATPAGMMRLPLELGLGMVEAWAEEFVAEPPQTAVDKLIPPGELRDDLNRRLKAVA